MKKGVFPRGRAPPSVTADCHNLLYICMGKRVFSAALRTGLAVRAAMATIFCTSVWENALSARPCGQALAVRAADSHNLLYICTQNTRWRGPADAAPPRFEAARIVTHRITRQKKFSNRLFLPRRAGEKAALLRDSAAR
jgi:hypothetical protein